MCIFFFILTLLLAAWAVLFIPILGMGAFVYTAWTQRHIPCHRSVIVYEPAPVIVYTIDDVLACALQQIQQTH